MNAIHPFPAPAASSPAAPGPVPVLVERAKPAHRIASDAEAIETARALALVFAREASERDREGRLPLAEVEAFSQSGLWAITVPKAYGGAGVSAVTLAEVIAIISAADPNLGQIPQNHFYLVEALRLDATEEQKRFFFSRVLAGDRFGNALSERDAKRQGQIATTVLPEGAGHVVNGRKFYSTGALFAHWIVVTALNSAGKRVLVFLPRGAQGLTLVNDWASFGQRTTASGTTSFDNVRATDFEIVPHYQAFERPTPMGAVAQIMHGAIEVGIARGALAETIAFVRTHSRPWADSGREHAWEDPYVISDIGDIRVRIRAAEALQRRAGRIIDEAFLDPEARSVDASIAVAELKVAATEAALHATNKLFELSGTRSTLTSLNLDRYWRNSRTHTLHDPVRWKYHVVGNYWLNGVAPPRHGAV